MNKARSSVIHQPPYSRLAISRKGMERLDLLILAIETLEINASDKMLALSKQLGLQEIFPNSVELWKKRCYNPYRRTYRRGNLSNDEVEAFILLISVMADRLYPFIRQLLSSRESEILNNERWNLFNLKMKQSIKQSMDQNKSHIAKIINSDNNSLFFRNILFTLSLSSGPGGIDRLRASLFDPIW